LQLEILENRLVPSATAAITWEKVVGGTWPNYQYQATHDFYAIDSNTNSVVKYEDGQRTDLGAPPGGAVDLSAGLDYTQGDPPYLYALSGSNHSIWCNEIGIWFQLGQGSSYQQISAARYNGVYALSLKGNVELVDLSGYEHFLGAPGGGYRWRGQALTISAGFDNTTNSFQVFAVGWNHAIYVDKTDIWMQNSTGWQLVDNQARFTQLSATFNNEVYALDSSGGLYREWFNHGGGLSWWYGLHLAAYQYGQGTAASYQSLSAGTDVYGQDEVYVIDQFNNAIVYAANNSPYIVDYNVKELSATEGGWFFDVNYAPNNLWGGTPWQYDPNWGWTLLSGSVQ
jgi:hypothetical protein